MMNNSLTKVVLYSEVIRLGNMHIMRSSILKTILFLLLGVFSASSSAQQVGTCPLQNNGRINQFVEDNPNYQFPSVLKNKFGDKDTLQMPFFDDFSESTLYPDSTKWLNNQVYINNHFPKYPPTLNVATFDVLDSKGIPYNNTINPDHSGPGDSLISQPINLKDSSGVSYAISDSIMLSFFYQPNGYGHNLRSEDSIRLWFKAEGNEWIQVWSKGGQFDNADFEHVVIPILNSNFLHKGFQFMFTTYTKQVGNANHWHIDYVYLDNKRKINVDYYNDYAIQTTPTSLLKNYYAMPYDHFQVNAASHMADSIHFRVSNLYKDGKKLLVRHEAHSKGNQLTSSVFSTNTNNHLAQNSRFRNLSKYDISSIAGDKPIVINRIVEVREDGLVNDYKKNDKIEFSQEFHDYYAYDDGSAERGFGFLVTNPDNIEGQIAYGFDVTKEDTLYAIGTFFNQSVLDVSRKRFKYRIWQDLGGVGGASEDELIYESEELTPSYNSLDGGRTFTAFQLDSALILPAGKFYIGWWQRSMFNLNIGWDMNYGNAKNPDKSNPNLYVKTFGSWSNSGLPNGTLMMRPHFGSKRGLYAAVNEVNTQKHVPKLYPNPASKIVFLGKKYASVELCDFNGSVVRHAANTESIKLDDISNGVYFVRLMTEEGEAYNVKLVVVSE